MLRLDPLQQGAAPDQLFGAQARRTQKGPGRTPQTPRLLVSGELGAAVRGQGGAHASQALEGALVPLERRGPDQVPLRHHGRHRELRAGGGWRAPARRPQRVTAPAAKPWRGGGEIENLAPLQAERAAEPGPTPARPPIERHRLVVVDARAVRTDDRIREANPSAEARHRLQPKAEATEAPGPLLPGTGPGEVGTLREHLRPLEGAERQGERLIGGIGRRRSPNRQSSR